MLTANTFTYASPEFPALKRLTIRTIERLTGQLRVWRLYCEYRDNPGAYQHSFWQAALQKLEVSVDTDQKALAAIPRTGPLVVVANHPFGVLDGLIITELMLRVRSDIKVLTNSALCRAPEAADYLLPIDFSGTPESLQTNLETRRAARALLKEGGCIVVFPAGGVSSITGWRDTVAQDREWQPFIAKLIIDARAVVVPVFFEGQNGKLFQWASLLSPTLRLSLFMKEVIDKRGSTITVKIGAPVPFADLAHLNDRVTLCRELRSRTYALGGLTGLPPPKPAYRLGDP